MSVVRSLVVACLFAPACAPPTGQPMSEALTRPKFLALDGEGSWTTRACIDTSGLAEHDRLDASAAALFVQAGLHPPVPGSASCGWTLRFGAEPSLSEAAQLVWDVGFSDPDRFAATTSMNGGRATTTIFAASERGAAFGLRSAVELFVDRYTTDEQHVRPGTLVDYAGFARRGIIEGFYGPTFSADQRDQLITVSGYLRQNSYIYALKDADPFTHAQWRDPYDATWGPVVADAAAVAGRNFVDFVWAASPGWYGGPEFQSDSIHYGGDADFQLLVAKTENVRALGVQRFALFVDDVSPEFAWPDDMARFPSLVAAQAFLINRWDDYLVATGAPDHLWVVGTKYTSDTTNSLSGDGWQDYNRALAAAIHPEIQLFWTGPQVYSTQIAFDDLNAIDGILGRPVMVWDNWPTVPKALTGRSADLDRTAAGLLSNFVMDGDTLGPSDALPDFETSLGTIADYAWQPESYDPYWSLARWSPALEQLLRRMPQQ